MIDRSFAAITRIGLVLALTVTAAVSQAATAPVVTNLQPVTTKISSPVRLAADQFVNLYLSDPRGGGIIKYDRSGKWVGTIPIPNPQGVVVTSTEDLVVSQKDRVGIFASDGTFKRYVGSGAGQFMYASGIAVDTLTGYIYVSDSLNDCVQVFNSSGQPVVTGVADSGKPANSFGGPASGATSPLSMPTGLAFDKKGRQLAVADTLNGRVQFFAIDTWSFRKSIGALGSGPLMFTSPEAITFEYTKDVNETLARMYVVDSFQSRVQVIDPAGSGTFLGSIGRYGTNAGNLKNPSDAVFDGLNSRLIVVNSRGALNSYAIDGGTTPPAGDPVPPFVTVAPVTDITTNQGSVTFTGTVESRAIVAVSVDTPAIVGPVVYAATSVAGTLAWSVSITNLAPGANTVTVRAFDSSATPALVTRVVTFSATTAVALTVNAVTTPTRAASQTLTGTVETGATVTVNGAAATVSGTTWSFNATLADGLNIFTIVGATTGKSSSTVIAAINVIRTAPMFEVATLASGTNATNQVLTVRGNVLVDQNFGQVTLNGIPVPIINGTFASALLLAPGTNTVAVTISDIAGNTATDSRTITYDPAIGQVLIMSTTAPADGAVIAAAGVDVAGTASAGTTSVRIISLSAGTPVSQSVPVTNGSWSAAGIHLDAGLNPIQVTAFNGATQLASTLLTLTQAGALQPVLAITGPATDITTNSNTMTVTGTAGAAAVTATLDGAVVPVTFNPGVPGTFRIAISFVQEGIHLLAVSAVDAFGNSATSYRSIRFKTSAPLNFVVAPFTGQPVMLSGTLEPGSTLFVRRADGSDLIPPVVVGATGTWSITLPVGYDPATVNLFAVDAAGNSTRNGDISNSGGAPDIADAILALQIALGRQSATVSQLLHGDVAPLVNHVSIPDGKIDLDDVLLILRRVVGLPW